ncbi:MAG: hypothetical protein LBI64_08025 [Coriobacteriales bacterium]|nr:hypothetical protein [Coriobacteriales bacterium]
MRRTIFGGGEPDRFVNQYEALRILFHPWMIHSGPPLTPGNGPVVNAWGVTNDWPEGTPGQFPIHTPDKIVLKDIENWRDYVKAPSLKFAQEEWDQFKAEYDAVDPDQAYVAPIIVAGLFEQTHHLGEIANALTYYITNPDEMHELLKYLTEWELELAEGLCTHLKPNAIFHHDDWGTEISTFLRPEMFAEFFVEPYKQIYSYYHDHGVELTVHHSDSYAATLVPYMIEMGIDVWQGCMESNDVFGLLDTYRGQIAFMGNIDNKDVDFRGWTQDAARIAVERACPDTNTQSYIPCITQGGPGSVFPGTYVALTEEIDKRSAELFGVKADEIERLPLQILF